MGDWAITDQEHKEEVHGVTSVPYAWRPGNLQARLHSPNSGFLLMPFCLRTLKPLILLQTGCSCVLAVQPSPSSLGGFFMLMEAPSSEDKTTANRIHCYSWFTKTQEQERPSDSPWVGEDMEIVVYVPFCWFSLYYPRLLSVSQGKCVSKCHKWARKIKWMTTKNS